MNLFIYLFMCVFIYVCIYVFMCLFGCVFIYLFMYLCMHLFMYLFMYVFIYLFIMYLFIYLFANFLVWEANFLVIRSRLRRIFLCERRSREARWFKQPHLSQCVPLRFTDCSFPCICCKHRNHLHQPPYSDLSTKLYWADNHNM